MKSTYDETESQSAQQFRRYIFRIVLRSVLDRFSIILRSFSDYSPLILRSFFDSRTELERRLNGESTEDERRTNGERTENERRTNGDVSTTETPLMMSMEVIFAMMICVLGLGNSSKKRFVFLRYDIGMTSELSSAKMERVLPKWSAF